MKKKLAFAAFLYFMLHNPISIVAQKPSNMNAVFGMGGRFEVFVGVSGDKGAVYHTWQTSPGGAWNSVWTPYYPVPDDNPHGLVAGKDGTGHMMVAWISNGNIFHAEALNTDASLSRPSQAFSKPVDFDGKTYNYTYLAIANNSDGKIEILALNERGRVISIKEEALRDKDNPMSWKWTTPLSIGGGLLQNISVTKFNGQLAIAAAGKDGKVWVKMQRSGEWGNDQNNRWIDLGGNKIKEAYAQESKDHQLEVVALGSDKSLYLNFQNVGTNSFSGWQMLLNQQTTGKLAPTIFFERFKDGSLFVVSHKDAGNTQFVGGFGKAYQSPNNGSWSGIFYSYRAVTTHQTGVNTQDYLDFLSPAAFALSKDANGDLHYFSCYRVLPRVEHYIDNSGASSQRSLAYENREHEMPDFPWLTNKQ
jgi:hypothetical protein